MANVTEVEQNEIQTPAATSSVPAAHRLGRGFWTALSCGALVLLAIVAYGIYTRSSATRALATENKSESVDEVRVVYPSGGSGPTELALPGNTQAYVDTPIYSRTNGYLKQWFFDIGAHVRKGQLMATIETPELDQQLQVAQADLKASEANLTLAKTTSARYQALLTSNSVSRQETDEAVGSEQAKEAAVESSMAGVRRLQQLQSFERVYAPFDGIVTARNTDIGSLITAGTGGGGNGAGARELFHLAAIGRLRVFVAVPEAYSNIIRDGGTATLTLDEFPGKTFTGDIARNASSIDPASRTLNVEVDVPNADGKLLPGAYATVHFKIPGGSRALTLPSNTLLFRAEGLRVGIVRNGRVQLQPVTIGQDRGATVEIASGVTTDDAVVLDPPDSLENGTPVKIKAREQSVGARP